VIHAFEEHTYIQTSRCVCRFRTWSFEGVAFWVGSRKPSSRRRRRRRREEYHDGLGHRRAWIRINIKTTTQPESNLLNLDQAQSTTS
jgi:hypothetical protein